MDKRCVKLAWTKLTPVSHSATVYSTVKRELRPQRIVFRLSVAASVMIVLVAVAALPGCDTSGRRAAANGIPPASRVPFGDGEWTAPPPGSEPRVAAPRGLAGPRDIPESTLIDDERALLLPGDPPLRASAVDAEIGALIDPLNESDRALIAVVNSFFESLRSESIDYSTVAPERSATVERRTDGHAWERVDRWRIGRPVEVDGSRSVPIRLLSDRGTRLQTVEGTLYFTEEGTIEDIQIDFSGLNENEPPWQ